MRGLLRNIFSLNFLYVLLIAAQLAAIIFLCFIVPSLLPFCLTCAAVWLFSAITACILFAKRGSAEVKCGWFVLIAALPVAGSLIYLLATLKKEPSGVLKVNCKKVKGLAAAANLRCGTCEVGYDSAEYYESGAKFFDGINAAVERAEKYVYAEFYIFSRGRVFNDFVKSLTRALENGAKVKIILDGVGSAFKIGKRDFKKLKALGAEIKTFHRLTPFPHARLNFRDHRKIVCVDGKTAFTGGINVADEYAAIDAPYGFWKDSGVKIEGAAAKIFEGMFLSVWQKEFETDFPDGGKYLCMPYCDSPPARAFCEDMYVYAISRANECVHVMTPYFCTSEKTAAALAFAAQRGVDVKIILPHVPDKKSVFEISKAYAAMIAPCGVEFFEFTPGFMHAKCLICDGEVYLGSYNLDFRSTHYNFECGVKFSGKLRDDAERDFSACLALSAPLHEGKISPLRRFLRFVLKLFAPLI